MWDFMTSWGGGWCGTGFGGHAGYGGWGLPMLHGPFGLLLVLLAVFFVVRWLAPRREKAADGPGALDVLKRRYAAGELTKEAFERMRDEVK